MRVWSIQTWDCWQQLQSKGHLRTRLSRMRIPHFVPDLPPSAPFHHEWLGQTRSRLVVFEVLRREQVAAVSYFCLRKRKGPR